ncbi:hypothetical protein D3C79_930240 [compost metagenome]
MVIEDPAAPQRHPLVCGEQRLEGTGAVLRRVELQAVQQYRETAVRRCTVVLEMQGLHGGTRSVCRIHVEHPDPVVRSLANPMAHARFQSVDQCAHA